MTWRCFLCDSSGLGDRDDFQNHVNEHRSQNPARRSWTPELRATYASDQQTTLDLTRTTGSRG